mmetsp:Transcript_15844/g.49556  ORF Transcript_15844/g.49556 Transcript_15844/m.49556 type:complete len:714 (-) Transcript_15844:82-2223(-)
MDSVPSASSWTAAQRQIATLIIRAGDKAPPPSTPFTPPPQLCTTLASLVEVLQSEPTEHHSFIGDTLARACTLPNKGTVYAALLAALGPTPLVHLTLTNLSHHATPTTTATLLALATRLAAARLVSPASITTWWLAAVDAAPSVVLAAAATFGPAALSFLLPDAVRSAICARTIPPTWARCWSTLVDTLRSTEESPPHSLLVDPALGMSFPPIPESWTPVDLGPLPASALQEPPRVPLIESATQLMRLFPATAGEPASHTLNPWQVVSALFLVSAIGDAFADDASLLIKGLLSSGIPAPISYRAVLSLLLAGPCPELDPQQFRGFAQVPLSGHALTCAVVCCGLVRARPDELGVPIGRAAIVLRRTAGRLAAYAAAPSPPPLPAKVPVGLDLIHKREFLYTQRDRAVFWLAFHLSQFDYTWSWEAWQPLDAADADVASRGRDSFTRDLLDTCAHFAEVPTIRAVVGGTQTSKLLPPTPQVDLSALQGSPAGEALLDAVEARLDEGRVAQLLQGAHATVAAAGADYDEAYLAMSAAVGVGSRSIAHFDAVLERYSTLLTSLCSTPAGRMSALAAIATTCASSSQWHALACDRAMKLGFIRPASTIAGSIDSIEHARSRTIVRSALGYALRGRAATKGGGAERAAAGGQRVALNSLGTAPAEGPAPLAPTLFLAEILAAVGPSLGHRGEQLGGGGLRLDEWTEAARAEADRVWPQ